jgi:hypothetical protein
MVAPGLCQLFGGEGQKLKIAALDPDGSRLKAGFSISVASKGSRPKAAISARREKRMKSRKQTSNVPPSGARRAHSPVRLVPADRRG